MENQENKVELDQLIYGLGVISNVLQLAQFSPIEPDNSNGLTSDQLIMNYNSLCEMAGVYTDHLISKLSEVEKNWRSDSVDAAILRKIEHVVKSEW